MLLVPYKIGLSLSCHLLLLLSVDGKHFGKVVSGFVKYWGSVGYAQSNGYD
jgi:hypothetical protein